MTAASMALALSAGFEFSSSGPCVGDHVSFDGAVLLVAADGPHSIAADAPGAACYDGLLCRAGLGVDPSTLSSIEGAARIRREAMCGRSALNSAASAKCDALLGELARSTARGETPAAEQAARALLGLGPGLTPSGDDALCGFMLGRRVNGGGDGLADRAVKSVAFEAAGFTSDVSAVQLALAAKGRFGEALLGVATGLHAGISLLARADVVRCLDEGATSGADALLGLVAGVRAGAQPTRLGLDT